MSPIAGDSDCWNMAAACCCRFMQAKCIMVLGIQCNDKTFENEENPCMAGGAVWCILQPPADDHGYGAALLASATSATYDFLAVRSELNMLDDTSSRIIMSIGFPFMIVLSVTWPIP
eukprot:scaffold70556_cov76-Attheya_sp.AAC.1